jgi:hypothetical protein
MYGDRLFGEFIMGLQVFLRVADANTQNCFVVCSCSLCKNQKDYSSSRTLHIHLLQYGLMPSYNYWTKHGEIGVIMEDNEEEEDDDNYPEFPEYGDTFMGEAEGEAKEEAHDEPTDDLGWAIADARRYSETDKKREKLDRVLEDHKKSLYPKYENGLKKMGSTLELLKWKADEGLSDSGFEKYVRRITNCPPVHTKQRRLSAL